MVYYLLTHYLDLLTASTKLYAGGNAYPGGNPTYNNAWQGVVRVNAAGNNNTPKPGFVNIFDGPYRPLSDQARPAIYLGDEKFAVTDMEDEDVQQGGGVGRIEFRRLIVPFRLVVSTHAGYLVAWQQICQLRQNVRSILYPHIVETNYSWDMQMKGMKAGGLAMEKVWVSGAPAGGEGLYEGYATVPLVIRYSYNANSPA